MPVLVALGAFLMTLVGGLVAGRVGDRRHLVLGLAAGLMLGVVGFDLLPEALDAAPGKLFGVAQGLLMFVLGFLVLHIVERSVAIHRAHESEYAEHHHGHRPDAPTAQPSAAAQPSTAAQPSAAAPPSADAWTTGGSHVHGRSENLGLAAASALCLHSVMDGFAIGAAFQVGDGFGSVVAIAVIAHDFADGFNTYTITRLYGNDRRRAVTLLLCDAAAPVLGAGITLLFTIPEHIVGLYLGFFAGFLMYLATSDILPEAHSPHPSRTTLLCTVLGAGFMWLVIGLAS
ncbi:ZIP family metal transporter [Streptacidiphilus sp. PB12-B1b]|uniref:ZIP family metal transporter n=1 Tax=Streptacidiphilus sp. PB12-B1b TaxID=2705012 RepID=UPI001CDB58E8|nr:ZIP family metal transporter [Streptacidiphilus sp. PB12-B1b]QMU75448.1 ZIP family metal transporter [Streptacidiphilus sp. PB12-B1b]